MSILLGVNWTEKFESIVAGGVDQGGNGVGVQPVIGTGLEEFG